jgi:hypothetical protein
LLQTLTSIVLVRRFSVLKMQCAVSMMQRLSQHCVAHMRDSQLQAVSQTPVQQHTK